MYFAQEEVLLFCFSEILVIIISRLLLHGILIKFDMKYLINCFLWPQHASFIMFHIFFKSFCVTETVTGFKGNEIVFKIERNLK